jgi:hypothetical protein
VPADVKWSRDLVVAKIILNALQDMDPQVPPPDDTLHGITVE